MLTIENSLSNDELFLAYPKPEQAAKMISSVIENYYSDVDKNIIIDKNRSWVNRLHYIPGYFGVEPKVICPVRNMDEILASFISMHRRNPMASNGKINFMDEMLIKNNLPLTDENRCMVLSNPEFGIVGQSYNAIRQAIMEGKGKLLHFVEYDDLLNQPDETMRKIYEFLGEEYYQHDFSKIENIHKERDAEVYGLADMHDVRENLNKISGNPKEILPETVYEACQGTEFWRNMNDEFEESSESTEENLQEHNIFEDNSKEDEDKKIIGG
jgi:sulfotransferase